MYSLSSLSINAQRRSNYKLSHTAPPGVTFAILAFCLLCVAFPFTMVETAEASSNGIVATHAPKWLRPLALYFLAATWANLLFGDLHLTFIGAAQASPSP